MAFFYCKGSYYRCRLIFLVSNKPLCLKTTSISNLVIFLVWVIIQITIELQWCILSGITIVDHSIINIRHLFLGQVTSSLVNRQILNALLLSNIILIELVLIVNWTVKRMNFSTLMFHLIVILLLIGNSSRLSIDAIYLINCLMIISHYREWFLNLKI